MLISCKCLNFIATSSSSSQSQQQPAKTSQAAGTTADAAPTHALAAASAVQPSMDEDCNMSSNGCSSGGGVGETLATAMMNSFLQRYSRSFPYYSQCMDFFKQSVGPIPDLAINALNQRELIFSLTLDVQSPTGAATENHAAACNGSGFPTNHATGYTTETWQLSICINCNSALCAKRLTTGTQAQTQDAQEAASAQKCYQNSIIPQYLVNAGLLISTEELMQRQADKSFSEAFGLLIMDYPHLAGKSTNNSNGAINGAAAGSTGSHPQLQTQLSSSSLSPNAADPKQQRLRQLEQHLHARLQRDIAATEERIQRYSEQQFALLRSFREKSEQEYQLLANLILRVPAQATELLDANPPALDVNGGGIVGGNGASNYTQRRRNTISSRRDLNVAPPAASGGNTTPTTPILLQQQLQQPYFGGNTTTTNSNNNNNNKGAMDTNATANTQAKKTPATSAGLGAAYRKVSNFDTPPTTPEATPMSIGNSPTFRQQQSQQDKQNVINATITTSSTNSFQQQFPTPTVEANGGADDFIFELDDINFIGTASSNYQQQQRKPYGINASANNNSYQRRNQQELPDYDDDDDDDSAEEAEDALDVMPIPTGDARNGRAAVMSPQLLNFAKSLPIGIANSPMAERFNMVQDEEEVENSQLDIAASIKALAKSVHGEAVFGDLPRPRLRSQI